LFGTRGQSQVDETMRQVQVALDDRSLSAVDAGELGRC